MKVVAISPRTLLWVAGGTIAFWLVGRIGDLLVVLFLSIIVSAAVRPAVIWGEAHLPWLPRQLTPVLVFVVLLALLALAALLLAPVVTAQASAFAASVPMIGSRLERWWQALPIWLARFGVHVQIAEIRQYFASRSVAWLGSTAAIASAVAGGITTTVFVFIGAFFIVLDEPRLSHGIIRLAPLAWRPWVAAQFEPIAARLGGYVRGLAFNTFSLATMLSIAYSLAGVPFGLVLGIVCGLLAVIPFAELAGFMVSMVVAFAAEPTLWSVTRVVISFGIAEVLQQNLIGPFVMSRAIALPPVVLIFSLLVGARLLGIEGMVVAVPMAAAVTVLIENLWFPLIEGAIAPGQMAPPGTHESSTGFE